MIILVEKHEDGDSEKIAIDYGRNIPDDIEEDLDKYMKQEFPNMDSYSIIEGMESIMK